MTYDLIKETIISRVSKLEITDIQLLGEINRHNPDDPMLVANNYYKWYYVIAEMFQPKVIGEIGGLWGYSAWTMLKGCDINKTELHCFDNCSYYPDSLQWAEYWLSKYKFFSHYVDTQTVNTIKGYFWNEEVDLFHVDGDHSYRGAMWDIGLVMEVMKKGGVILVDDIDSYSEVKKGADTTIARWRMKSFYLPTHRGMYVIER